MSSSSIARARSLDLCREKSPAPLWQEKSLSYGERRALDVVLLWWERSSCCFLWLRALVLLQLEKVFLWLDELLLIYGESSISRSLSRQVLCSSVARKETFLWLEKSSGCGSSVMREELLVFSVAIKDILLFYGERRAAAFLWREEPCILGLRLFLVFYGEKRTSATLLWRRKSTCSFLWR